MYISHPLYIQMYIIWAPMLKVRTFRTPNHKDFMTFHESIHLKTYGFRDYDTRYSYSQFTWKECVEIIPL